MVRIADATIPDDEALYRSISREHVFEHGVLASAVEMPACSFNRRRYSPPEAVLVPRPTDTGIVEITPSEIPAPIPRNSGEPYEFMIADDPIEGNDAHCEIRLCRRGFEYSTSHKPKKDRLMKAREELAKRLRFHRSPD